MTDRAQSLFSVVTEFIVDDSGLGWNSVPPFWPRGISGGLTLRTGGVSTGSLSSLNLGSRCGDQESSLAQNLKRLSGASSIQLESAARIHLEHGNRTLVVTKGGFAGDADGLVTNQKGLPLALTVADCFPVFMATASGAIALVHCGWRGVVAGAAVECLNSLREVEDGDLSGIRVWIGPGIGRCCFEVGEEVANLFPEKAHVPSDLGVERLDLPLLIGSQLIESGLRPGQISVSGLCTACRKDLFYSHRRDQGDTGRMLAWICAESG